MARIEAKLKTAALALLLVSVTIVMAASVEPQLKPQHWDEHDYCKGFAYCVKFEPWTEGDSNYFQRTEGGNTITVTSNDGYFFSWTSTYPITVVIVKNGDAGSYLYEYPGGSTGDTGLRAPPGAAGQLKGISHVTFCWNRPSEGVPEFPLAPEAIAALGLVAWTAVRRRRKL